MFRWEMKVLGFMLFHKPVLAGYFEEVNFYVLNKSMHILYLNYYS